MSLDNIRVALTTLHARAGIDKSGRQVTENNVQKNITKYVCFSCVEGSNDPEKCTNCGEKIERIDFNTAVFIPPQTGCYRVEFNEIPEALFDSAVEGVKKEYLQRFTVVRNDVVAQVQSLDIAYDRLIDMISSLTGCSATGLKNVIIFEVIDEIK